MSRALPLFIVLLALSAPASAKPKPKPKGDFLRITTTEMIGPVSYGLLKEGPDSFATFEMVGSGVRRHSLTPEEYSAFVMNYVAPVLQALKPREKTLTKPCQLLSTVEWRLAAAKPAASKKPVVTCLTEPEGTGVASLTRHLYLMMQRGRNN
jgi:hypothetical protein